MKQLQSHMFSLKNRVRTLKKRGYQTPPYRRRTLVREDPVTKVLLSKLPKNERVEAENLFLSDADAINAATYKLGFMKSEASANLLRHLITLKSSWVKLGALWNLSYIGKAKDLPLMSRLMYDKDPLVKHQAIECFGVLAQTEPVAKKLLMQRAQVKMNLQTFKSVKKALSITHENGVEMELMDGGGASSFNDKKRSVVRVKQIKDGSTTVLLGGKLKGKAIVREIDKYGLDAWRRAKEVGIPVEPILTKNGKERVYKTKDNFYRVSTGVLNGSSMFAFVRNHKNQKYISSVFMQADKIKRKLGEYGIIHGHFHPGNLVVVVEKGRAKVYLIDFDQARVPRLLRAPN